MKKVIYGLAILMAVLHQDFWLWDSRTLVLGFIPIGLFYHAVFSCVAALLWFSATRFAWPTELEKWADTPNEPHTTDGGNS
ncbi:MAG: DUF3311 domain-containing protein [Verrucomicrobia bacterium]|nr:DUF3311 domain-containing protein [Verrucomicrobiota bacterium]